MQVPSAEAITFADVHVRRMGVVLSPHEDAVALQLMARHLLIGKQDRHEGESSRTSHRVPAVEAFVAGAGADGDGAADVAGGGVLLHFDALLT